MHIHTKFSYDGQSLKEEYCRTALNKGLQFVCFTEHVDFNEFEYKRWQYDAKSYFKEIERLRKEYKELNILSGMEFSEPHLFKKSLITYYLYHMIILLLRFITVTILNFLLL